MYSACSLKYSSQETNLQKINVISNMCFQEFDPNTAEITLFFRHQYLRTFAGKFSNIDFFLRLLPLKVVTYIRNVKKNEGSPTSFRREQAWKITLNLKNRASLANKATMLVSPKIIQSNLWSEMFSAKYCSSRPIKWNESTGEVP